MRLRQILHGVDRREVTRSSIDVEQGCPDFLLNVAADHPGAVAAHLQHGAGEHSPVHRIVGDQPERRAVRALDSQETDLAVGRPVGIESEGNLPIGVARAAVDVGTRETRANGDARGREPRPRVANAGDERGLHKFTIVAIPRMIGATLEQDVIHPRRTDLGRRMTVRDSPPELARLKAQLLFQRGRDVIIDGG